MQKFIFFIIILAGIVSFFLIPPLMDQFVEAGSPKKIHFTQTITSSQDPGVGHESHELSIILSPNEGTLYDGSLTFAASKPVEIVVLHEISKDDAKDQPLWTVDGKTVYGLTMVEPSSPAGSFEFTGAALALHSLESKPFTATVSVDGWIRGQPTEVIMKKIQVETKEPSLKLSRANVNATIPLHTGLVEGGLAYFIITDTNDQEYASTLTERQEWKVEFAPTLNNTSNLSLGTVYVFTNGVNGNGTQGFQSEVLSSTPEQKNEYSPLGSVINVTWKPGQNSEQLDSIEKILEAEEAGRVTLEETELIINIPQILWPEGQMLVRVNQTLSHDMEYGGGQVLDIDLEKMTVSFIAHRGWGPDGRTIYYIVTDATPSGPAEMMGVVDSPSLANLISTAAASDLFQFTNGIRGSGPMGFQPGISSSSLGDSNYSPIWRIFTVSWVDPENAKVLETREDIDDFKSRGLIEVNLAKPMNSDHIVNCPFIDPFQ